MHENELRQRVDATLEKMISEFYTNAPLANYQKDSESIDLNYFKRHTIETILRIRHKRMIDALVIHYFTKHNPYLAKSWANYIEDEMLHGKMFAYDIQKLTGITFEEIYEQYQPLFATKLLNGYFYFTLEHEGPLASIVSAYFLEYTTRKTQPEWLDNLERVFGKENLMGARGHVDHDIRDNHNDFVWDVLLSLIKNEKDENKLFEHLYNIYGLFVGYFINLKNATIDKLSQSGESVAEHVIRSANMMSKIA